MLGAVLWRGPSGKELKEVSSQQLVETEPPIQLPQKSQTLPSTMWLSLEENPHPGEAWDACGPTGLCVCSLTDPDSEDPDKPGFLTNTNSEITDVRCSKIAHAIFSLLHLSHLISSPTVFLHKDLSPSTCNFFYLSIVSVNIYQNTRFMKAGTFVFFFSSIYFWCLIIAWHTVVNQ